MTRRVLILLVSAHLLALGWLHSIVKKPPDPEEVRRLRDTFVETRRWLGKTAPDFEIGLIDGGTFALSEHVGKKVIVINFFTTWCEPCLEEMPELDRFYREHRDEGLIILAVDGGESAEKVRAFIGKTGIGFPVAIDATGRLLQSYSVKAFPKTVVIGVDGRVWLYEAGKIANADVALQSILRQNRVLLDKGAATTKEKYLEALKARPDDEAVK